MRTAAFRRMIVSVCLATMLWMTAPPAGADVIEIEDSQLKMALLYSGAAPANMDPYRPVSLTEEDMGFVITLVGVDIYSLSGLEYAVNMEAMILTDGQITDLTPIAGLESLMWVELPGNEISDLAPLADMVNLQTLMLADNQIADLSPLAALADLWWVHLENNRIRDISALASLTGLDQLYLQGNRLNREAYDLWLGVIAENNPGIDLRYDPWVPDGDANADGVVDLDDFVILKSNFDGVGGWAEGDFDGDGDIDLDDFAILKENFGVASQ